MANDGSVNEGKNLELVTFDLDACVKMSVMTGTGGFVGKQQHNKQANPQNDNNQHDKYSGTDALLKNTRFQVVARHE